MSRGADGRPLLDVLVAQWPLLIFVPAVLVLIAVLALITRWWDRRDESRRTAVVLPFRPRGTRAVTTAVRSSPVRSAGGIERHWLRRTRCTCSWHAVPPAPLATVRTREDATG